MSEVISVLTVVCGLLFGLAVLFYDNWMKCKRGKK